MDKKEMYKECLVRGFAAIRPVGQRNGSKKPVKALSLAERRHMLHSFTVAREDYKNIVARGDREETALNMVLFEATDFDFSEFKRVVAAIDRTIQRFEKLKLTAAKTI